jgi:hypothetical protein
MRKPTLHRIAIVVVAVALGSAVIATDAVAAGGHGGESMGGDTSAMPWPAVASAAALRPVDSSTAITGAAAWPCPSDTMTITAVTALTATTDVARSMLTAVRSEGRAPALRQE